MYVGLKKYNTQHFATHIYRLEIEIHIRRLSAYIDYQRLQSTQLHTENCYNLTLSLGKILSHIANNG